MARKYKGLTGVDFLKNPRLGVDRRGPATSNRWAAVAAPNSGEGKGLRQDLMAREDGGG